MIKVLINDSFKKYMLSQPHTYRKKLRQKIEYLEIGYWDGGLNVKKLKSLAGQKVVFEARLDRANRILFTVGHEEENGASSGALLVYIWGIVVHDRVSRKTKGILPGNVPFLQFKPYHEESIGEISLENLDAAYFTQESITQKISDDSATQRWHLLDEESWGRIQDHQEDTFELQLYLTPKQQAVLNQPLPTLVSGTAGSGKTTLGIYYLLKLPLAKKKKLFITYNHHLKNAARKLYHGLLNTSPLREEYLDPVFFTFKEYCLDVAERFHNSIAREKEVDFEKFSKIILSCPQAKGYDAPLIWEEIRSIIKGALPQININILKNALVGLKIKPVPPRFLSALQQQFYTFAQLKSLEKVENFVQKYLGTDIMTFSRNLSHYVEAQGDRVLTVIDRTFNLLSKARELTQKKYLSFVDYEALGKKKAPNFQLDRHNLYRVFEWYQERLHREGLWDELDLTREVVTLLSEHKPDTHCYDLVVCDEVQDLTDVQHELLFYTVRNPMNLLLCGDTKQTINPSGFRWEELKRHFYERKLKIPDIHFLNLNFRSSGSIVELSNILLELKAKLLGSSAEEPKEDWKYKGRPPVVVRNLDQPTILESIRSTSAKKTILVRTEEEKKYLRELLDTELIFTINEAKGLEFDTVLLWKFGSDVRTKDIWKVIIAESDQSIHQAKIKHEINLLYVAITRAQRDLLIYDDTEPSLIWRSEPIRDKVYITDDVNYISSVWNVISAPDEWLTQGHYFFERRYYKAAMECYKNAGEDTLLVKARAYEAEKRQDFQLAANCFQEIGDLDKAASYYEKCGDYEQAFLLWSKSNSKENAHRCHLKLLEQKGRFGELADIHLSRKAYRLGFEFLVKAKIYDQAAEVSLKRLKDKEEAAYYYEKGGLFKQSAVLYEKLKNLEKAAALFEKAKDFDSAMRLWRHLKRQDRLLSIYQQTGDYSNQLKIYEKARDFDNAVKVVKKLSDSEDLLSQAHDFFEKRKYFPALVRYYVAKDHDGTAMSYFKLKNFAEAARFCELAHDYYHAAKAYQKLKNMKAAFVNYLKSEEDRQNNFADARRVARHVIAPDIINVGHQLHTQQQLEAAELCFTLAHDNVQAGCCALQDSRREQALNHWRKCLYQPYQIEKIAAYCLRHDFIKVAAEFLLSEPPYAFSSSYYYDYDYIDYQFQLENKSSLVVLMDKYFEQDPDEKEMVKWVEILTRLTFSDELQDKKLFYLEKSRRYDHYFSYLRELREEAPQSMSKLEKRFKREYPELVKDISELSAIKLYFLGKFEDFNRIVRQLQITEHNYRIFAESTHNDKAMDMMMEKGEFYEVARILLHRKEFLKLAEIYEQRGLLVDAANYYNVAGKYGKSAGMFEKIQKFTRAGEAYYKAHNYEKALAMYVKSGKNKAKIAQTYEKLGEYAKAADLWKELGKPRKYNNCVTKLDSMDLF